MLQTKITSFLIFPGLTFPYQTLFVEHIPIEGTANLSNSTWVHYICFLWRYHSQIAIDFVWCRYQDSIEWYFSCCENVLMVEGTTIRTPCIQHFTPLWCSFTEVYCFFFHFNDILTFNIRLLWRGCWCWKY